MNIKSITRTTLLTTAFFAPALTSAQGYVQNTTTGYSFGFISSSGGFGGASCSNSICGIASTILYLINAVLVPLLFAVAFIVFLYGVANAYILHPGDEAAVEKGHKFILWGIIGFVVMVSLWGLVNVVANTFGLSGVNPPPLPYSPPTR